MARMYPSEFIDGKTNSNAEKKMYKALSTQLNDEWSVFYNVAWLGNPYKKEPVDGEADFIVAHPDKGAIIMEVKGGRIVYKGKNCNWFSIDKNGNQHFISPFEQSMKSKYALRNKILEQKLWQGSKMPLYHCVAFTDIKPHAEEITLNAPREIIIYSSDMQNLETKLNAIFSYWKGESGKSPENPSSLLNILESLIASDFELKNIMLYEIEEEEEQIIKLTKNQYKMLDFLNRKRQATIGGCAGSGKTFLAMEKARRLSDQGFKTLLTCYNKQLAERLTKAVNNQPNLIVANFHKLCINMAKAANLDENTIDYKNWDPATFANTLRIAVNSLSNEEKFDAVIIDEGQDFTGEWLESLKESLKDPEQGIYYCFFDDNQNVYNISDVIRNDKDTFTLSENIRNTRNIFNLVSRYYKVKEINIKSIGPAGRDIEFCEYKTQDEFKARLSEILTVLIKEKQTQPEHITVLSLKSIDDEGRSFLKDKEPIGDYILTKTPSSPNHIHLSTVYSFKGLENRIIILTDIDDSITRDKNRRELLFYTAFSRPRNHLVLMGIKETLDIIREG